MPQRSKIFELGLLVRLRGQTGKCTGFVADAGPIVCGLATIGIWGFDKAALQNG